MLCAELEELEAKFDDIITALEAPDLNSGKRALLERERDRISRIIEEHQKVGHRGGPCFEE